MLNGVSNMSYQEYKELGSSHFEEEEIQGYVRFGFAHVDQRYARAATTRIYLNSTIIHTTSVTRTNRHISSTRDADVV
jgi:hypothetical protein